MAEARLSRIRSTVRLNTSLGIAIAAALVAGCTTGEEAPLAAAPASPSGSVDLAHMCNAADIQKIADSLTTKVTLGRIANIPGPAYADGIKFFPAAGDVPAFCQVTGSYVTNPATGKTSNFLATLPENWNGKYLQLGCGGHCGTFAVSNPAAPTITITNQGTPGQIMRKGYAAFATDEGHTEMTASSWAVKGPGKVDQDAIDDFLYRSQQVLAKMGKEFTRAFYAQESGAPQAISRSYFSGCSGGGRDALVAASFMPGEFDGIIAGSPYDIVGRSFHSTATTFASIRFKDAGITQGQLDFVQHTVMDQCDGLDGVKDGLIQNPMACNFKPERDVPVCAPGKTGDQCFSRPQLETLSAVLTAVTDEKGDVVQPGYSVSELQNSFQAPYPANPAAEDPWAANPMAAALWSLGDAVVKVFTHQNDPAFRTRDIVQLRDGGPGGITAFRGVVPQAEVKAVQAAMRMGYGHNPATFDTYLSQNRKLLIWHNFSDEKLTPYMSVNLYKKLAARHGGYSRLQRDARLFSLPGTAHCSGGGLPIGPGSFDALSAMENWVEKGQAPDSLLATLYKPTPISADYSKPLGRTMPLCKFPEMAKYSGSGDIKDAANWTCSSKDKSMLKLGESGRRAGVID